MAKAIPKTDHANTLVTHVSDDTLADLVGYNVKRASNVIQSDLARTLKPLELRMITFSALVMIADNPGLRQSQLADVLAIERPNCVAIIDELEQRILITRLRVPTDRRAYALKVTKAGQQLYKKALRTVKAHENALLDDFSNKEHAQINAAMQLIGRLRKRGQNT